MRSAEVERGPLIWFKNIALEPVAGTGIVYSLRFFGANVSQNEVELKSADIVYAIDGSKLPVEIVASKDNQNVIVQISSIKLIPPGARIELVAKFNLPQGIQYKPFLEKWSRFFVNITDNTRSYRLTITENDLAPLFSGSLGPRVSVKDEQ